MREKYISRLEDINVREMDAEKTCKRIQRIMELRGISIRELSEAMHLSFQTVYHWTTGRSIPEIGNLYVLSQYLEVPVDTLIVPFDNGKSDISSRIQLVDRNYREVQYYCTNVKYLQHLLGERT